MIYGLPIALLTLTVILLLRGEFALDDKHIRLWKPLSSGLMTVILLLAYFRGAHSDPTYILALLPGILLCFGGDMALMFMRRSAAAFRVGLLLFLLGHVAYSITFTAFSGFLPSDWLSAVILVSLGSAIYLYLYPGLGAMKISVLCYILIISFMMNRALSTFGGTYFTRTQAWLLFSGAALFYISDVVLALGRFRHNWKYGRISLAFYYSGQALIALSAGFGDAL